MRVSEAPCQGAQACKGPVLSHQEHVHYRFQTLLFRQPQTTESEPERAA